MDRTARRRLIALLAAASTALFAGCSQTSQSGTSPTIKGSFALSEGAAAVDSSLLATRANGALKLSIVQERAGAPIHAYNMDLTQQMHLIIVPDDFSTLQHLHPSFDAKTGRFSIAVRTDPARRYYVYADTHPHGAGQQVFRFAVQPESAVGSPSTTPVPSYTPSPVTTRVGPYAVTLSTASLHPSAMTMLDVSIDRNGKPATDLQPYLGAPAHVVAINTATLEYAHVHPSLAGAQGRLMVHLPELAVGSYKMWIEFRGGSTVYPAPFTLVVR